jgi:hypothetical protein
MPQSLSPTAATLFFWFLLTVVQAVRAEERTPFSGGEWRTVTGQMSFEQYRTACHRNQHLLRKGVKSYSVDALRSAGVPEPGIRLLGVVAGVAVDGDARLNLNRNRRRRLALEFRDIVSDDRSLFLGIRLRW